MTFHLHSKRKKLFLFLSIIGFLFSILYSFWWIKLIANNSVYLILFYLPILAYIITQAYFVWYIYLNAAHANYSEPTKNYTVDIFLPTYKENIELIERNLKAITEINYPHSSYVIDDGKDPKVKELSEKYGAIYIARENNQHHKAGNINNAIKNSKGELIAIFDVDHIPESNFISRIVSYFDDPGIGVVQVALDHYNQSESIIANAGAKMSDEFFGATMLGMQGCDCAVVFGSNSIFRREALMSIEGYKPGLAEDLNTSISLHSAGWKSVYHKEILAKGLVPADISSFYKQQLKWSRGVFDTLLRLYPKLAFKLSFDKNICYLTRMSYYLAGPIVFFHILFSIVALLFENIKLLFNDYIIYSFPFVVVFLLMNIAVKRFYRLKILKPGFHLEGLLLSLSVWPIYVLTLFFAILGIKNDFIPTPKEKQMGSQIKLIMPQIFTIVFLSILIIKEIYEGIVINDFFTIGFSLLIILMHSILFSAAYEQLKNSKK